MVNGSVGPIATALRTLFAAIDIPVYWLLKFNFELFFNIATFNLVDGKMIFDLFSRIQLIIGVFMLFELTMVIIKGIVNPDSFTDAKNGAGNVIKRVVIALLLLALLVPLNITSPKNEYEKQINNNGILFGTLYSLQNRLLSSNTLGRLILGDEYTNYEANDLESNNLNEFANRFTSTIVRTFYQPNLDENGEPICSDVIDEIYDDITGKNGEGANPASIIAYSDRQCDGILDTGVGGGSYALSIMPFVSTIAGIILVVLIFMMTFNVAKRTFQLAALQLMAPIPIISYMDPKGSKDSAFNSWLKLLGTTYLELFIQLAVIYFSFGIITSFMDKFELSLGSLVSTAGDAVDKVGFWNASPLIVWTFLIMVIALFIFAKDAPKFFKQMLGIKDNGKGFFSAFGAAMGLGTAAVGAIGSFNASRTASRDATAARLKANNANLTDDQARAMASSGFGNRAKNTLSGLFGAGMGVAAGSAAASESKGNAWAKMMASANAMNKRNEKVRAAGRNGSTMLSGLGSLGNEIFGGENTYDHMEADWKSREQKVKDQELVLKTKQDSNARRKSIMDRSKSKAVDCDYTEGTYKNIIGNYRDFHSVYEAAINNGVGVHVQYTNAAGQSITKNQFEALDATQQAAYHEESWFEYSYVDRSGVRHDNQRVDMGHAKDIDMGLYDKNTEDFYEADVRYERAYNAAISAGMTEQQAIAAGNAVGHKDNSIAADRKAYREATGVDLEDVYGSSGGLKAKYGDYANENSAESDRLNREREKINRERQSQPAQQAQYDAKRFRNQ